MIYVKYLEWLLTQRRYSVSTTAFNVVVAIVLITITTIPLLFISM